MIITKIVGGLGNQMFQYAIGRAASEKYGLPLQLDILDFQTYRRPYALDHFHIVEDTLDPAAAKRYRAYETRISPKLIVENLKPRGKRLYRMEKGSEYFKYVPDYLERPSADTWYYNGYWQHESYFSNIRDVLLRELQLRPERAIQNEQLLQHMDQDGSVAVHFRRGDDQLSKNLYGVPDLSYFHGALAHIARSSSSPLHAFVFSNDIPWVKEHFKPDCTVTYVDGSFGLTDPQELIAMSKCRHNVIDRSTFSWWAAWLNPNPSKIVVRPERWLNSPNPAWRAGPSVDGWVELP